MATLPALADPIVEVEEALIDLVRGALTVDGRMLVKTVESLPGDWDDEMLKRMLRVVPGVFVAWAGGPAEPAQGPEVRARWMVYTVTGHASGEAARRRGDAREAGAYALVSLIVSTVHNWAPEGGNSLQLRDVANLYTGTIDRQGIAVYAMTFEHVLSLGGAPSAADLADFLMFDSRLDTPPHVDEAQHRLWLQGRTEETQPKARDQVQLPPTLPPEQ